MFKFAIVGRLFSMILFLREYNLWLSFCELIILVSWRILKGCRLQNVLSCISLLKVWIEKIFVQNLCILSGRSIWFHVKKRGSWNSLVLSWISILLVPCLANESAILWKEFFEYDLVLWVVNWIFFFLIGNLEYE